MHFYFRTLPPIQALLFLNEYPIMTVTTPIADSEAEQNWLSIPLKHFVYRAMKGNNNFDIIFDLLPLQVIHNSSSSLSTHKTNLWDKQPPTTLREHTHPPWWDI